MSQTLHDIAKRIAENLNYTSKSLDKAIEKATKEQLNCESNDFSELNYELTCLKLREQIRRTKKRFITLGQKSYIAYLKDNNLEPHLKNRYFIDVFKSKADVVGIQAAKDYTSNYIAEFYSWVSNENLGISSFKHILEMPGKSINSSILKDAELILYSQAVAPKTREIYAQPNSIEGPTFTDSKLTIKGIVGTVHTPGADSPDIILKSTETFNIIGESTPYSMQIETLLNDVSEKITYLDSIDYAIFSNCLLLKEPSNFYSSDKVTVSIPYLSEKVFGSTKTVYLQRILYRLHKLARFTYTIWNKNESHTFGLISEVHAFNDSRTADVHFSPAVIADLINGHTTKIYHDLLMSLDQLSRNLLMEFQRERHRFPQTNSELAFTLHYTALLKHSIKVSRFRYVPEKINALKNALDNILELDQDILKSFSFEQSTLSFTIVLHPLNNLELIND